MQLSRRQPQHFFKAAALSIEVMPGDRLVGDEFDTGVEEIEARRRLAACRRQPANVFTASTPFAAISNGNCIEVAPITPSLTLRTPGQPPSTETIITSLSRPTDFSAS